MSLTLTFIVLSEPIRTTFGAIPRPPGLRTRLATSSIAALLGAQRRIFRGGSLIAVPAIRPATIAVGRGRFDKKAWTSPHIVDVLPVPGGLPSYERSAQRNDRNYIPLNQREPVGLKCRQNGSCLGFIYIIACHSFLNNPSIDGWDPGQSRPQDALIEVVEWHSH
jgi:hypothetical protein